MRKCQALLTNDSCDTRLRRGTDGAHRRPSLAKRPSGRRWTDCGVTLEIGSRRCLHCAVAAAGVQAADHEDSASQRPQASVTSVSGLGSDLVDAHILDLHRGVRRRGHRGRHAASLFLGLEQQYAVTRILVAEPRTFHEAGGTLDLGNNNVVVRPLMA